MPAYTDHAAEAIRRPITLRTIAPSAYGPAALFGVGQGAMLPVVAISARNLGASVGVAALVVAFIGIGQILGDLPAGALANRIGERRAMVVSAFVICAGLLICIAAQSVLALGLGITIVGFAGAVFGLARQSYLTEVVPLELRARALSTLGGSMRIGAFLGPFLAAWVTSWAGTAGAYWIFVVCAAAAGVLVLVVKDLTPVKDPNAPPPAPHPDGRSGLLGVAARHKAVLLSLGSCALLLMAVRQARQSVLPLWCEHLGMSVPTTSLLVGLSGSVDMLLFYPAGSVMDRFGRGWVGVPSLVVLGLGHALLPLSHSVGGVAVIAVILGVGNGMGAGLVMTLGADVSPTVGRPLFLSIWRLVTDFGAAGGPLVVSVVAALVGLGPASLVIAGFAAIAAAMLGKFAPRRVATPAPPTAPLPTVPPVTGADG